MKVSCQPVYRLRLGDHGIRLLLGFDNARVSQFGQEILVFFNGAHGFCVRDGYNDHFSAFGSLPYRENADIRGRVCQSIHVLEDVFIVG
ncbi:hypothetical protein ES703_48047 [subsurface metagenome]